jgi:hypothetical protein
MSSDVRVPKMSLIATAIGVIICLIGMFVDPARTAAAYLVAYMSCLAVVLGNLAMIMIGRTTAATWFVALRRQAEQVTATLPVFAVLFIPILVALPVLYPWTHAETIALPVRELVQQKTAYLNVPFFVIRAIVYLATWIILGELLRRASLTQDHGDTAGIERQMRVTSAVGLVAFAFTVSFAAFDWMMSLAPAWYSTIYGVDYFAGAMVGALALLAVLVARGRWRHELPDSVDADHFHSLAKLLLTFVLFWVYIGFSQLIVIWSGEIPIERSWYVVRMRGGWELLGGVLVAGHFAFPFLALLVREFKRSVAAMAFLGAWLMAMHYLDVYWIMMPDTPRGSTIGYWLDLGSLLLVGGAASATWAYRRAGESPIADGDPAIDASLGYLTD